jgi:hypothetical protein
MKSGRGVFRFGVEFSELGKLYSGDRVYSKDVDFLGSTFCVYIQKLVDDVSGEEKLGFYIQRNHSQSEEFTDKRKVVRSWFKMFVFVCGKNVDDKYTCFILESKPDSFDVLQVKNIINMCVVVGMEI